MIVTSLLLALSLVATPSDSTRPAKPVRAPKPPSADTTVDTTFYVTNRLRQKGALQRAFADSLEFGVTVSRVISGTSRAPMDQLIGRVTTIPMDSTRLTRDEFVRRLHVADSIAGETVMYVHGYATSFGRAMAQTTEIAHRGAHGGAYVLFSWPAHRAIATWPTFRQIISHAYRDDSASAKRSAEAFLQALAVVRGATNARSLTLVGHSLGAQLVAEALRPASSERDALIAAPLRAIVFFAPDISAERFRDSLAAPLVSVAQRRVVYVSGNDKMLGLSRLINHAPRAGQARGGLAIAPADVEVVDVTGGLRAVSGVRRFIDTNHAMRYSGTALYDFYSVARGVSAACRASSGIAARASERRWTLTQALLPTSAPVCTDGVTPP